MPFQKMWAVFLTKLKTPTECFKIRKYNNKKNKKNKSDNLQQPQTYTGMEDNYESKKSCSLLIADRI